MENMKKYDGTKELKAIPMNKEEYCQYRQWEVPSNENPKEEGYLVEYLDGGKPNDERHLGYISWSPKDVFEKTYYVVENAERPQTFGEKAVGITFNPSGSDEVYEAKMLAAKQIDLLEKVHIKLTNDSANTTWIRNVLRTQAFNALISAQMAVVKYLTWKD